MECLRCKTAMIQAKMAGDLYGTGLYLTNKKKGIFEAQKSSAVSCWVCPACGYVELKAADPGNLILRE